MHKSQNSSKKPNRKKAGSKMPSLAPNALNARKHSAQANITYTSPLVNQATVSRDVVERVPRDNFVFDAFAPHSPEEYQRAIAYARNRALNKHKLIEKSERQLRKSQKKNKQDSAILESAKALAEIALKENKSNKPFPYIKTTVGSKITTDRFLVNEKSVKDPNKEILDPTAIKTPIHELPRYERSALEHDINESAVRHEDPNYWAQGGIAASQDSALPASAFASDGPIQESLYSDVSGTVNNVGVPLQPRSASHDYDYEDDEEDLSPRRNFEHSMAHYRGGYMPCYFMYDNCEDRFLLDEGSCRLIGITYTGEWMPCSFVQEQIDFIDEEQIFSVFFNPSEGDKIFSHVKIMQGPHQGERLYLSGSVIQRDDTGIAMLVSGYFTQVKSNFMECLCKFISHSSSFDIDIYTKEVHFGPAFKLMLGLDAQDRLPTTIKEYEKQFVHPEDVIVYRKQGDVIYNPQLGDYYESIYRLKHRGGYYIWCIDRGLVIERKRSGKASRIIGTTTNIDVVRSNFERLKRSIYQDPLTGLHNRLYLNTRYKYFTMEESQPLSLVYVDISGLKVINDYLGHAKGDELVKLAAQILTNDVYLDHEVVRLSGDEFLLIFTNCSEVQCKIFINKFACTLDERNRNHEFPLPIYFGFGIATLNEIDDGDTFLRCEARADVRLQEYKTIHRQRIYASLQAFIEAAVGHSVVLTDNRRLEYLDNEPDVIPSSQLQAATTNESSKETEDNKVKSQPTFVPEVVVSAPSYQINRTRESALAALSRMQYATLGNAHKSAQVFMEAEMTGNFGVQLRATLDEAPSDTMSVKVADNSNAFADKVNAPFNQGNFPESLLDSNSFKVSWPEENQEPNTLSPEQERQLILEAERAALDDMRYAQNSTTIPVDLSAGFVSLENIDPEADVNALAQAHLEAKETRRQNIGQVDLNNLSDPSELTEQEAQHALSEAQVFLDKLQEFSNEL